MPESTARYDEIAPAYDASRGWPPAVAAAISAALYARLTPFAGAGRALRVLEIGAGTGRVLLPLAARGAWAVGLDASGEMLSRLAAKRAGLGAGALLYPVLGDAHCLPFGPGTFDVSVFVHILHLVGDWTPVLAEARRVLRPGGTVAFGLDEREPGDDAWLSARWDELVTAAGGTVPPNQRETATTAAVAALAAAGYTIREETLARWTVEYTPADLIHRYRARLYSASWDLSDAVLAPALAGLTVDLQARYGRLDAPLHRVASFRLMLAMPAGTSFA